MQRREFMRAVVSAAAAPTVLLGQQQNTAAPTPPAPVPWTAGLNPSTPVPTAEIAEAVAEGAPRFFTPAQMATLTRLSDLLLPPLELLRPIPAVAWIPLSILIFPSSELSMIYIGEVSHAPHDDHEHAEEGHGEAAVAHA